MPPLKLSAAILSLMPLAACGTAERPKTVSDTACTAFHAISFAQLPKGQTDDPGNKADSAQTITEISDHNARWDALCPSRP